MYPIDPRPVCGGPAFDNVDSVPDSWYDTTTFKGAFGETNWLSGWSMLDVSGQRGLSSSTYTCPTSSDPVSICGDITTDTTWMPGPIYVMTCQIFVKSGATLTIGAGTTIYATPVDTTGVAPALIVEQGGKIVADGTADAPITFTALNPEAESSTSVTTDTSSSSGTS